MYVIYAKPECSYCKRAKDLLEFLGEPYEYIDVTVDPVHKAELKERLIDCGFDIDSRFTMPQIWTENEYVGGFTELNARFDQ